MADAVSDLRRQVETLREEFDRMVQSSRDSGALQALHDRFLGRKSGAVTALLKSLGQLPAELRKDAGAELNALKAELERRYEEAKESLQGRAKQERLERERIDVTLPGREPRLGRRHPLTSTREELEDIFVAMGYEIYDGPEVDDDFHCFEALNMPPDH